jgi:hypothetical protein
MRCCADLLQSGARSANGIQCNRTPLLQAATNCNSSGASDLVHRKQDILYRRLHVLRLIGSAVYAHTAQGAL